MRSLNKIIFINSAAAQYAEISLDGNVHLIGTQGVGKSTLLRAILFFYNADKTKLGIPREKKNFDQYYFPYQNSYIIYEVHREDITYSIIAFKAQGRVAFRFFDARYHRDYFIDETGKAFPTFEQTKIAFGRDVYYTKIISNYEEYRNILYGNNKGLAAEFRKYALLESRQYQNIPRTIQNVFLNSRLDAAFIKETIIKSLSEEEIKIDLSTYAHNHLRNFETELNDIKIWSQKNKSGKIMVRFQAEAVAASNRAYVFVEAEKKRLSMQLGWFLNNLTTKKPAVEEELKKSAAEESRCKARLTSLEINFGKKQKLLQTEIGIISGKLKNLKEKKDVYEAKNIETIVTKVGKKSDVVLSKRHLQEERHLLTGKFEAIEQKYQARLNQLETQLEKFKNNLTGERLNHKENFAAYKENLHFKYERLIEQIEKQHREAIAVTENEIAEKDISLFELKIKEVEIRHQPIFKDTIAALEDEKKKLEQQIQTAEATIENSGKEIIHLKKEWELENARTDNSYESIKEKFDRSLQETNKKIATLHSKINDSKGSFYEWLNIHIPGWDNSIGRLVDEDVLFSKDLNPELSEVNTNSFYGIKLDLDAVNKQVKTLADYEEDILKFSVEAEKLQMLKTDSEESLEKEKHNWQKKFRPKINTLKEESSTAAYQKDQFSQKLLKTENTLHDLKQSADAEREKVLAKLRGNQNQLTEEKQHAVDALEKLLTRVKREVSSKNKEKKELLLGEQTKLKVFLQELEEQFQRKEKEIAAKTKEIKDQEKSELDEKGADTGRIEEIDKSLDKIDQQLNFIEANTPLVIEYQMDKRELFDREPEFRSQRSLYNKELEAAEMEYRQKEQALLKELKTRNEQVKELEKEIGQILQDLEKYEEFQKLDWFSEVEKLLNKYGDTDKTELGGAKLIENIREKQYSSIHRLDNLKEAIIKFTGNFAEENIFNFPTRFNGTGNFLNFAEDLKEFLEEDKISEYEGRVNERFSHIIRQIGKETGEMLSKEGEINRVIQKINSDFVSRNFVGAIKSMEMRTVESSNKIMKILLEIKMFNDENGMQLGKTNLFSSEDHGSNNERAVKLLKQLLAEINLFKADELTLSDSFGLEFRIVENDNDSQWVEKLSNVGSEGTDVLVKAMINIMLLNVFKDNASKKFKDFKLHCMMDEIGRLHPNNVKGILKFANDRNILLINGSPTSYNATEYRYTYILSKTQKNFTTVKRLVQKIPAAKNL